MCQMLLALLVHVWCISNICEICGDYCLEDWIVDVTPSWEILWLIPVNPHAMTQRHVFVMPLRNTFLCGLGRIVGCSPSKGLDTYVYTIFLSPLRL